jgi:hypothetical protein
MTAHEIVFQVLIGKLSRAESDDAADLIVDALAKADLLQDKDSNAGQVTA